ncbi:MAG: hypothetical protein OIF50_12810 [Flavobacteriaceae bacterium]|nr:hypothetical protein [Flavobacteriaceae bacterium]
MAANKKQLFFLCICYTFFWLFSCGKESNQEEDQQSNQNGTAHLKAVGDSALDLLSANTFPNIVFDMVYPKDHKPSDQAITEFSEFVLKRTHKQTPTYKFTEIPSQNQDNYSLQEIVDIEKKYRTAFNTDDTIAVFVFFADAEAEADFNSNGITLGVAFRNTSMAIYQGKIKSLTTNQNLIKTLESSTLQHELGHLFGLVNNGAHMIEAHEDKPNGHHCNNGDCLMTAVIEFTTPAKLWSRLSKNNGVPELDHNCIADLQEIGGR